MPEELDEREEPTQDVFLYTEKDFLLNEVLMGSPITEKHEEAIQKKTIEEVDELPTLIAARTKGNLLHFKYAMEAFADLKLSTPVFTMQFKPRNWEADNFYLLYEINQDVDSKRKNLCRQLCETIANQQSLCWEFVPRMKILKAYALFLKEENERLTQRLQAEKENRKAEGKKGMAAPVSMEYHPNSLTSAKELGQPIPFEEKSSEPEFVIEQQRLPVEKRDWKPKAFKKKRGRPRKKPKEFKDKVEEFEPVEPEEKSSEPEFVIDEEDD